ncbi:hypothetical protein F4781DRAFT_386904 [Annulohypoxylon bovei var. microspora]|nr:hypothetical protein F4781DRAFT_386904 [Annulohypoxylon bovei var. microspora]
MEAPPPPPFITIEKRHFDVLLRQADVHFSNERQEVESVICIPKDEYEGFVQIQYQYANLVRNLLASGVAPGNLWNLTVDTKPPVGSPSVAVTLGVEKAHVPSQRDTTPASAENPSEHEIPGSAKSSTGESSTPFPPSPAKTDPRGQRHAHISSDSAGVQAPGINANGPRWYPYPLRTRRSLVLEDIPRDATYWDVTSAVRGGVLADFIIRASQRVCIVSFLTHDSATRFYDYSKKKGLYINTVRVPIRWADNQFILTPHIANIAGNGATRNLVIRGCRWRFTEGHIRADLEHIYRLVIIKIEFVDDDCHIKTNSIQGALYARTCMMSRSEYQGFPIEWDIDECSQLLHASRETILTKSWRSPRKEDDPAPAKTKNSAGGSQNPFESLNRLKE